MSRTFGDYAASPTKRQKRSTRSADREVSGSPQTESGFLIRSEVVLGDRP